jgi:hypothetical protein
MITKQSILHNLNELDRLYKKSVSIKKSNFYAKLAVLELCGWVEESMDDLIRRCYKRKLISDKNIKFVEDEIIGKTYGFHYDKNFRPMLMKLFGILVVEKVELRVNSAKFHIFNSNLGDLKKLRDRTAHTHIKGVTMSIDAPSITTNRYHTIYEGLKDIEDALRRLKFLKK